MPAPTLTVADALADYGLTVMQPDLDDAAELIHMGTSYTLAEHVDTRTIPVSSVRRAWAIVAARLYTQTRGDTARSVTSESDADYSYSESERLKAGNSISLLSGVPMQLLDMGRAQWYNFQDQGLRLTPETDDYGTEFPTV